MFVFLSFVIIIFASMSLLMVTYSNTSTTHPNTLLLSDLIKYFILFLFFPCNLFVNSTSLSYYLLFKYFCHCLTFGCFFMYCHLQFIAVIFFIVFSYKFIFLNSSTCVHMPSGVPGKQHHYSQVANPSRDPKIINSAEN